MKLKTNLFIAASLAALQSIAFAGPLYKLNNTVNLNQTTSWTTFSGIADSPPAAIGSTDALYFNEVNMGGDKTLALGAGGLSVGGIAVDYVTTDSANNVVISAGDTLTLNGTTLNSYGIDGGAGANYPGTGILLGRGTGGNLTINSDVMLGAHQSWVSGRKTGGMTIAGPVNLNGFGISAEITGSTSTISGKISGTGAGAALAKYGDGVLIVSGDNAFPGGVRLGNSSTSPNNILEVGHANALGSGTFKARGGLLRSSIAGLTLANPIDVAAGGFRVGGANSFTLSGTTSVDAASRTIANYGTATVTLGGITTVTGSVVAFDNAANAASGAPIIVSGAITGAGGVAMGNNQRTIFNGVNTYTGATTVSGGRISGSGTLPTVVAMSGGSISLAGGATTGGALTFKAGATFTNAPTVVFDTPSVIGTTYDVFNYTGTLTNLANLKSAGRGAFEATATKVTFTPGAANQARTWNGTVGIWDGTGTNANWLEGDKKFYNGDSASFPEPAGITTVTISGAVAPSAVTISNTTFPYAFAGGSITGTTALVKSGAGSATLATINSFTGGTTINGGVLTLTAGGASGAIRGTATINAGGTLRLSVADAVGYAATPEHVDVLNINEGGTLDASATGNQTLSNATINMTGGAITGLAGSDINFYRGASTLNTFPSATTSTISGVSISPVRQGPATFTVADGPAAVDLRIDSVIRLSPPANDQPGAFTKAGDGLMKLTAVNTLSRSFNVAAGTLEIGGAGQLGSGNYSPTISNNGVLAFSSSASQTLAGVISGTGSLAKSGSGVLTLTAFNDFTGPVSITGGTLVVAGSLSTSSAVSVAAGGTLKGLGFVDGDVTVNSGGNLAGSASFGGTLTMGTLTLASTGATINIPELQSYTVGAPLTSEGNLTVSGGAGSVTLNLPTGPLPAGLYHIIASANSLANASQFVLGTAPALGGRQSGTLVANPGYLDYQVTGTNPTWTGAANGEWSTTVTSPQKNWDSNGPTDFISGDAVTFGESASTYAVTIPAAVYPAAVIFDNLTNPYTLSGAGGIAGSAASVVMNGASEVTLNTANTYGGGTTVNSGTLIMGNAASLGDGPVTLGEGTLRLGSYALANNIASNGGTLAGSTFQVNGVISGTTLTINATGIVKFSGVNTYTGATTMASGGLEITGTGQLNSGAYAGAISNPALLRFDTSADQTLSGAISGTGLLVKNNSNTLTLAGNSTYTGTTTVNAGTIKIGHKNALGAFQIGRPVSQVVVASDAAVEFNGIHDATYGYTIAGTGVGGTGALTNSGTTIGNGIAQVSNIKLSADASIGGSGNWALLAGGWGATTLDLDGHTLTKSGANTLGLVSATTTAGTLRIASGTVALGVTDGGSGVIGGASAFSLDNTAGVTLSMARTSSLGSLAGGGTTGGNVTMALGSILTVGALNTSTVYDGVISGAGVFTKTGSGTLLLTNASTYTSGTTISGGTLDLSTTGQLYTGAYANTAVVINNGGTLKINNLGYNVTAGSAASLGGLRDYADARVIDNGTFEVLGAGHSTGNNFSVTANGGTFRYAPALATDTLALTGNANSNLAVAGALTLDAQGNVTISEVIAGTGSLTKTGGQTLTLSGSNTYLGDTIVNAGVLAVNGNAIADTGRLVINGGKVAPSAMETVDTLYFGEAQQASGTWGASGSNAEHIDDAHFSGSSVIKVTTGPAGGYSDWAATNAPAPQTAAQDYDGDGVSNAVEYVLGGSATTQDGDKLPTATTAGGDLVFRFKRIQSSKTLDTSVAIEVGTTLVAWPKSYSVGDTTATSTAGVTVSDNGDGYDTVTLTIQQAPDAKKFARLNVTVN